MIALKGLKRLLMAVAGAVLVAGAAVSHAGAITTGSWVGFCFGGADSPASVGCQNDATQTSGNAFTFSLLTPMVLAVTDAFQFGDTFSVFEGATLLFSTPIVPVNAITGTSNPDIAFADPGFSHGSILLGVGSHSIDIFADVSPFGGGGGYVSVGVIPEPEIYAMLAAGLGLMGYVARRRKQQLAAA